MLAGGIVAAVLGPLLGRWGGPRVEPAYVGSFLLLSVASLLAAGLLAGLQVPHAPPPAGADAAARPLAAIVRQPSYLAALFGAATGYGVMILAMTATPIAMVHHHHAPSDATLVIQLHVLGMFVPSFFTGSLIARYGVLQVMLAGVALLAGHVLMSLTGTGLQSFASALVLLGVGWNFLYIGGTTLVASLGAGALLEAVGWQALNLLLLPWLAAAAAVLTGLAWRRRRAAAAGGGAAVVG